MFILFLFLLIIATPWAVACTESNEYVIVIASQDLVHLWTRFPKYRRDMLAFPKDWEELPGILQRALKYTGNKPLLIDFHVHGNSDGLHLQTDRGYSDRASFGYVVNKVKEAVGDRKVTVLFESCYAGRAYKHTIRGAFSMRSKDNIEDCAEIPDFPIYGAGDSFSVWGPVVYVQYIHHIKAFWIDLRDYDPKGKNRKCLPLEKKLPGQELTPSSAATQKFWNDFSLHVPE